MVNQISWLGNAEARIINNRKFRQYIDTLPFEIAVKELRKNWKSGPKINKKLFDISNVMEWPTPWDLFSQQYYCSNSQILGIFYTLLLSEHSKTHTINLVVAEDLLLGQKPMISIDNYPLTNYDVSCIITKNDVKNKLGE